MSIYSSGVISVECDDDLFLPTTYVTFRLPVYLVNSLKFYMSQNCSLPISEGLLQKYRDISVISSLANEVNEYSLVGSDKLEALYIERCDFVFLSIYSHVVHNCGEVKNSVSKTDSGYTGIIYTEKGTVFISCDITSGVIQVTTPTMEVLTYDAINGNNSLEDYMYSVKGCLGLDNIPEDTVNFYNVLKQYFVSKNNRCGIFDFYSIHYVDESCELGVFLDIPEPYLTYCTKYSYYNYLPIIKVLISCKDGGIFYGEGFKNSVSFDTTIDSVLNHLADVLKVENAVLTPLFASIVIGDFNNRYLLEQVFVPTIVKRDVDKYRILEAVNAPLEFDFSPISNHFSLYSERIGLEDLFFKADMSLAVVLDLLADMLTKKEKLRTNYTLQMLDVEPDILKPKLLSNMEPIVYALVPYDKTPARFVRVACKYGTCDIPLDIIPFSHRREIKLAVECASDGRVTKLLNGDINSVRLIDEEVEFVKLRKALEKSKWKGLV